MVIIGQEGRIVWLENVVYEYFVSTRVGRSIMLLVIQSKSYILLKLTAVLSQPS